MTVQPNGTDAKDIALHFINMTSERATPSIIKKTIGQAKTLLSSGYNKDEIIKVIDYILDVKKVDMYSLGYVSVTINDMLKEIRENERAEQLVKEKQEIQEAMHKEQQEQRNEVKDDGESTERNKSKLSRFGVQPRFGKEFNLDLFEVQRQDN